MKARSWQRTDEVLRAAWVGQGHGVLMWDDVCRNLEGSQEERHAGASKVP